MPMNNNQKVQSAAARLSKLPVVRSACARLSVLYSDTKCRHPGLRSVCEGLESSVTALASPALVHLEAHISIANDVVCKSLDWLETTFPVIHAPTEQIVATAKNKMTEIQEALSSAADGTVGHVQHTVTWLTGRVPRAEDRAGQPLVERAIGVASVGLDSALNMSEALMDRVLPPTEEVEEEAHLLEGFEAATLRRGYLVRLVSLVTRLCRRTHHVVGSRMQSAQVSMNLSGPGLVQDLQTSLLSSTRSLQELPQYLQHRLVSALFFISQMYNFSRPPSRHRRSNQDGRRLSASEVSPHKDAVQVHPKTTPPVCRKRRPAKTPPSDNGCNVKGCVGR